VTATVDPFATESELVPFLTPADKEPKRFGNVYNGRYHMPCLPGEEGTKDALKALACTGETPWVPYGLTRMTNVAGAFVDSEALSIWEMEQALFGLALDVSLYEEVCMLVRQMLRDGVDLQKMRDHPELRRIITGTWKERDASIVGRAKHTAGANIARQKGINRHTAWQERGEFGTSIGTVDMHVEILAMEQLLEENHLERVPGLSERVVRNMEINAAGRFDDILVDTRTGEMFIADLKTKAREFFTWLEIDIQLAGYARAEWMLGPSLNGEPYSTGPRERVNQERGVVLHMPSDGAPPRLRRADLVRGWENAKLARRIMDERSYGRSAERFALAEWTG
jgi:hypothetical protein